MRLSKIRAKKVRSSIARPLAGPPFEARFFAAVFRERVRALCAERPSEVPVVLLHLADGSVLDLCHITLLGPRFMAAAVYRDGGECADMDAVFVPYEMILRVTLSARSASTRRTGFKIEKSADKAATSPERFDSQKMSKHNQGGKLMKTLFVGLLVAGLAGFAVAQEREHHHMQGMDDERAHPADPPAAGVKALKAGRYTATVKALACSACGPKVVETMNAFPGIADAAIDQEKALLSFSVKKGAKIDVAALQKKLAAVSAQMGMGADYSLSNIKAASKVP